jgi:hypothetical protein
MIGIALLLLAFAGACIIAQLFIPQPLTYEKEPIKAFLLGCARTLPTEAVFLLGLALAFRNRKRCPLPSGLAAVALLIMLGDHVGMYGMTAWWNAITASPDLEDRVYATRMESRIHVITAASYAIWTVAFGTLVLAVFVARSQWSPRRENVDATVPPLDSDTPGIYSQTEDTRIYRKP